jgi:hypothetical protein
MVGHIRNIFIISNSDRTLNNIPKAKDFWRQKILDEIHKFKKSGREIKVKSIAQEINYFFMFGGLFN